MDHMHSTRTRTRRVLMLSEAARGLQPERRVSHRSLHGPPGFTPLTTGPLIHGHRSRSVEAGSRPPLRLLTERDAVSVSGNRWRLHEEIIRPAPCPHPAPLARRGSGRAGWQAERGESGEQRRSIPPRGGPGGASGAV
ncbi:hypothetical protein EYF80_042648 [Liparis tanakae]|uniref:Uncharacterized protein n=1 Tax=Liparis tanakae TaxID=230148 RepID=A0A4Z2G2Q6_9TELE|nr:hypothetical protein EYF80_042648 [Liparis tanakae]